MVAKNPLRLERERRGWSQARLAEMLGTSTLSISRWERGTVHPSPYFREKLSALFKKDARALGLLVKIQEAPSEQLTITDPLLPSQALPSAGIIGRERLLHSLTRQLCSEPTTPAIALHGLPGVGKTTLLIALTGLPEIQKHFSDGILWAGLGSRPQIFEHLARWGNLLQIPQEKLKLLNTQSDLAKALRTQIGSRRLLLILDDIWHVEDALALQVGGSQCVHLITTRFPNIASGIGLQHTIQISELEAAESRKILSYYLPHLAEQEPEVIEQLAQDAGMLPLMLNLVGKHLSPYDYSKQKRRLHTTLEGLHNRSVRVRLSQPQSLIDHHPSIPPEQPLSLEAIITVSAQQLSRSAQRALSYLSLIPPKPNSFAEEMVTTLIPEASEALDELVDAGLVESYGLERYTMHQSIADFAFTLTLEEGNQEQLRSQLLTHAASWLKQHTKDYEQVEREYTNLLMALTFAIERHDTKISTSLASSLQSFWLARCWYLDAHTLLQQILPLSQQQKDLQGEIHILQYLGDITSQQSHHEQATTYYLQSIELARQAEIPGESIPAFRGLSLIEIYRGNHTTAEEYARSGMALAQQQKDRKQSGDLLNSLAISLKYQNRFEEAEPYFQEALSLAKQNKQEELATRILNNLGGMKWMQGLYQEAEDYYRQGLKIAQGIGHQEVTQRLLNGLGNVFEGRGDYKQASMYYEQSLTEARKIGSQSNICFALYNLAATLQQLGQLDQAEASFRESLAIAYEIDMRWYLPGTLTGLGEIAFARKHYAQAEDFFHESLKVTREHELEDKMITLYGLARNEAAQDHLEKALEYGRESVKIHAQIARHKTDDIPKWVEQLECSAKNS